MGKNKRNSVTRSAPEFYILTHPPPEFVLKHTTVRKSGTVEVLESPTMTLQQTRSIQAAQRHPRGWHPLLGTSLNNPVKRTL